MHMGRRICLQMSAYADERYMRRPIVHADAKHHGGVDEGEGEGGGGGGTEGRVLQDCPGGRTGGGRRARAGGRPAGLVGAACHRAGLR
jgi:hypothetical protein